MIGLVNTMLQAGKADQALSFLQSVLKASPDNAQALVLLGSVHFQKREFAEAEANFQAAIGKRPVEASGYLALSQLYVAQKKLDSAEKTLRAGLEHAPDNTALHQNLAIVLEQEGEIEPAIQQYEYLLQQDSGSLIAANNLASLLSDNRKDKASLDRAYSLAQMLSKSPIPSFQDTLGWIQFQRGDANGAIKLLEVAANALPTRAIVQYHLGVAYEAAGKGTKAREQFDKALKLNPDEQLVSKIKAADAKIRM
jgi:tetratricopeptide (TPR) repeat protein